jgi:hypothetical protein
MRNSEDRWLTQTGTTRKYCQDSTRGYGNGSSARRRRPPTSARCFIGGTVREFVFYSDEPPDLWGEDEHPRPLDYLLASVGF